MIPQREETPQHGPAEAPLFLHHTTVLPNISPIHFLSNTTECTFRHTTRGIHNENGCRENWVLGAQHVFLSRKLEGKVCRSFHAILLCILSIETGLEVYRWQRNLEAREKFENVRYKSCMIRSMLGVICVVWTAEFWGLFSGIGIGRYLPPEIDLSMLEWKEYPGSPEIQQRKCRNIVTKTILEVKLLEISPTRYNA